MVGPAAAPRRETDSYCYEGRARLLFTEAEDLLPSGGDVRTMHGLLHSETSGGVE